MKRFYFLNILFAAILVFATLGGVEAQSLSGDDVCGKWDPVAKQVTNPCTISSIGSIMRGVLTLTISIGLPLLVVFIIYRFIVAWFALQQGNANAYKDALKKSMNAIIGFIMIVVIFGGGLVLLLRYLGVQSFPLQLLDSITEAFIPHAYAQTTSTQLPNPVGANSLYDFILAVLRMVMRFFVFPALIVIWVWTGFSFVAAQGNPEALNKAKKWLVWAFVSTLVVFLVQAFLFAIKGTVDSILSGNTQQTTTTVSNGTTDGRGQPTQGGYGSSCTTSSGASGVVDIAGVCQPGRGAGSSNTNQFCTGKAVGTVCTVSVSGGSRTGTCSSNQDGTFGCYIASQGDTCISASGAYGTISAAGNCEIGGRALVGAGGSCRIQQECSSGLTCTDGVCR